jgi:hypothetical protein
MLAFNRVPNDLNPSALELLSQPFYNINLLTNSQDRLGILCCKSGKSPACRNAS